MQTFEDLVAGRVPARIFWRDERHLAFLAPRPVRPGHAIVLPRAVDPYLFALDAERYHALWEAARVVALRIEAALGCERVCVAVVGWEVRHVHVHLVPTDRAGEFPPLSGAPASAEELDRVLARLGEPQ